LVPPIFSVALLEAVRVPPAVARLAVNAARSRVPLETDRLPVTLALAPRVTVLAVFASVRLLKVVPNVPPIACAVAPLNVTVPDPAVKAVVETLFIQLPATPRFKLLALSSPAVIVKFPVSEVAAPRVVVPPLIARLLKEVKTVAGIVLVVVSSTLPVPGVQVLVFTPVPSRRLRAISLPPLVMLMAPFVVVRVPPSVTAPETVSCEPELKIKVPEGLAELPPTTTLSATALEISTFTVRPPRISTESAAVGINPAQEAHVAGTLQLPVAAEKQLWA